LTSPIVPAQPGSPPPWHLGEFLDPGVDGTALAAYSHLPNLLTSAWTTGEVLNKLRTEINAGLDDPTIKARII
jgi:hypothetical protein